MTHGGGEHSLKNSAPHLLRFESTHKTKLELNFRFWRHVSSKLQKKLHETCRIGKQNMFRKGYPSLKIIFFTIQQVSYNCC